MDRYETTLAQRCAAIDYGFALMGDTTIGTPARSTVEELRAFLDYVEAVNAG
jgi:hypothetical protein